VSRGNAQSLRDSVVVDVSGTLDSLLTDEDTDRDTRITIEDARIPGSDRGDRRFRLTTVDGERFEVAGTYPLSNLLQQLKLAEETGRDIAALRTVRIFEPPVDRISRSIRELYWPGLTRSFNEQDLVRILSDDKTAAADGRRYLYLSPSDKTASDYFSLLASRHPEWKMAIVPLPERISAGYVRGLDGHHGILSLSVIRKDDGSYHSEPFVVPGGRFNEMYGWDSYFITLGLLHDGEIDLAQSMVNNFVYQIQHYGAILNANRTYYLTRSQPPFLTSMALAVYEHLPREESSRKWLQGVLQAAITEYYTVWMNKDRLTSTGLSRYHDSGYGPPPEVEPGHFDAVFSRFSAKLGMIPLAFGQGYKSGSIKVPELDAYFVHDRAMRESGHDTSYRLEGRCADLVTVDLNALLFKIETDIGRAIRTGFDGSLRLEDGTVEEASAWEQRAAKRAALMNRYLWNQAEGMFFDYDFVRKEQTGYVSATTFYPMWAGLATPEQAESMVRNALPLLEMPGGVVGSTEDSRGPITPEHPLRQWDSPYGWAPHQILVWQAMINYGYDAIASRLAYRWLYTITLNAVNYNGTVPEKFDVVRRTHQVFAEYGNVGTTFSYITREGFGWTNASYQLGLDLLPETRKQELNELIAPEWIRWE